MIKKCRIRITRQDFDILINHLFPGDGDEHGAVLLAGMSRSNEQITLLVREIHLAEEGIDYIQGKIGHRALNPTFIHKLITRARDQKLIYLAVHNHGSDREVNFSSIDLESHERGYPALLQIARGMPVGALVFGRNAIEADIWLPNGNRLRLDKAIIVGNVIQELTPSFEKRRFNSIENYDRQIRMFGKVGQAKLANCHIAIVGLGGIGSLIAEYLARLGVGQFDLIDMDSVEKSNLSRIVGASLGDARAKRAKVIVAKRLILEANPKAKVRLIKDDIVKESIAKKLTNCDYLFLAADSMRARLVFNALVHQYLLPGVQLGSKIRSNSDGNILDIMSVNRPVRPGRGCLWCNQFIDTTELAKEAKTDAERKAQAYGVQEPNPSVISLNAVSAAHAANDFLLDYLGLRAEREDLNYEYFNFLKNTRNLVQPRKDSDCSECSNTGQRYARGDLFTLPCAES